MYIELSVLAMTSERVVQLELLLSVHPEYFICCSLAPLNSNHWPYELTRSMPTIMATQATPSHWWEPSANKTLQWKISL